MKSVFLALEVKEQPMIQAIILTVAAVLCIALTADNLKAAVKKVDNSAAAVEVALKGLMAA